MKFNAHINVMPQRALLDPQGRAVSASMKNINLSGKTIIITGGYSGIGLEMTKQLSRAGAKIIIPARRMG